MTTAYVQSPIGGYISGRTNYCCVVNNVCSDGSCTGSCSPHGTCKGWSSPVDIGGSGSLYLRVNYPTVRSIVTWVEFKCCSSYPDDIRRTITVDLYYQQNAVCYIGSVMFGHISSPQVGNGVTYNLTSSTKWIGNVPTGYTGGCYTGPHSHMERFGGSTLAPCCCQTVYTSTNIYSWAFDPANCAAKVES